MLRLISFVLASGAVTIAQQAKTTKWKIPAHSGIRTHNLPLTR